jgi:uncharacterized protein (TIGR02001 family)
MEFLMRKLMMSSALLAFAMLAAPAIAQGDKQEASGPIDVEFTLAGVSDYRFRGLSLSDKDPAFQPSMTITHESGLYASVWGSNIAANSGDDIEVDLTAGYSKEVGDYTVDVGAVYYAYPGASSLNYVDILGSVSSKVGPGTVKLFAAYAPKQKHIGSEDNFYWGTSGELPLGDSPVTLVGSIGVENGAFGDHKVDWSAGLNADVKGFTLGASYVDTARTGGDPLGKAGVVFSLSKTF